MKRIAHWIVALAISTGAMQAVGQISYEGCVDYRGIPVASIANMQIQDVAIATNAPNGAPIIVYNPGSLSWLAAATRLFFYAHECAHHVLGHGVSGHPLSKEQEADCWGIKELVNRDAISGSDLTEIQNDIARFARADWTHLAGPQRAINLSACLGHQQENSTEDEDDDAAWEACYDKCSATEDSCTSRCPDGAAWEACYDRCERRFDACTNRCK